MQNVLKNLGLGEENPGAFSGDWHGRGEIHEKISPVDGKSLGKFRTASAEDYEKVITRAQAAFLKWRATPGPVRGETVRQLGNALREQKRDLGMLVSLESGKILAEGEGEVQEMIDICDFAVGQSRMLYGLTIQSERPRHRLMEQWHPLGLVAVISAFNFPVAVWSWNAALAAVCGDATIWKPSEKTPLSAIAVTKIAERVCQNSGADPAIFSLLIGDRKHVGEKLAEDRRIPLVSATGSVRMGIEVAKTVHGRLGKTIMELGGNNALIVCPSADLEMATQSIFFGAVGTAGQRCTSTRRVIMHESIADQVRAKLLTAYKSVSIGSPLDEKTLMGPLIDRHAVDSVLESIGRLKQAGGEVLYGGERLDGEQYAGGCYMTPCLTNAKPGYDILCHETFGPLLYLMTYRDFDEALAINNGVPQGLTSAIFTNDLREAEKFLGPEGSDCGIANVNTGTSGAEIGGAFGGEKETGGGRESGSDSWKMYMRRTTNTINYSTELPLAQGIRFGAADEGSATA
ncbi:MAG TPA: aldehyde dehydrogenase family protein [Chthoniobacterales bacterium]